MLIKENKPKFNILLRDDKTYPYIYFSSDHDFPGVYLKRTKKAVDEKLLWTICQLCSCQKINKKKFKKFIR